MSPLQSAISLLRFLRCSWRCDGLGKSTMRNNLPNDGSICLNRNCLRSGRSSLVNNVLSTRNNLAVTYVILLRVLQIIIPPRAKYVILLGHALDTENYIFQKLCRIRGRSATKICNFSGNEFPHNFLVYGMKGPPA